MASVHHLCVEGYKIPYTIRKEYGIREASLIKRQWAAVKIQKVWRGYKVRKAGDEKKRAVVVIQRWVRGHLVRLHMFEMYQESIWAKAWVHYNKMATKIQAWWRGVINRKHGHNIKDNIKERNQMQATNDEMAYDMKKAIEQFRSKLPGEAITLKEMHEIETEAKSNVIYILFKLHHLLRTKQIEGIYSLRGKSQLSYVEKLLKSLKFKYYIKDLRKLYECQQENRGLAEKQPPKFKNRKLAKMEELYYLRDLSLGPKGETRSQENLKRGDGSQGFSLNTKLPPKKYERSLIYSEKYTQKPASILRTYDKTKNISKASFDLHVHKKCQKKESPPPYYLDFWMEDGCPVHNCTKIFHNDNTIS